MRSTFILTLRESIRYRGLWGHWSWLAHRVSGLAILLYLTIHVWDTANATFWPEAYSYTVEVFKWFPFSLGEIALMAAVLYHAFNGIRITLLDFQPAWWRYQRQSAILVWVLFAVVYIPIAFFMFARTLEHCSNLSAEGLSCFAFPLP
jgi:succinate dehydrogenase / fumarate reductase cytochrome b subunit